jgi:hypothetical protein
MKAAFAIAYLGMLLACAYGWAVNLWAVVQAVLTDAPITTLFIARAAGILVAPLGIILGWVA